MLKRPLWQWLKIIEICNTEIHSGATAEQLGKRFCWWNKGEVNSEAVFEQGVIIEGITSVSHPPFPLSSQSSNSFSLVCSQFVNGTLFFPLGHTVNCYYYIKRALLQNFSQSQLLHLFPFECTTICLILLYLLVQ